LIIVVPSDGIIDAPTTDSDRSTKCIDAWCLAKCEVPRLDLPSAFEGVRLIAFQNELLVGGVPCGITLGNDDGSGAGNRAAVGASPACAIKC